ncbi:MAG: hypothetical protein U0441_21080 [Polyangiaceae bacterium]
MAGARGRPVEQPAPPEPYIDELPSPDARDPVLLELGVHAGASIRGDDGGFTSMTKRAGFAIGGSAFVFPTRFLSFGLDYMHADLDTVESAPGTAASVAMDHSAHTLMLEAKVVPFHFTSASIFLAVGGGLAWQSVATRASLPPVDGSTGGTFACSASGSADFAFRVGLGVKARVTRAASVLFAGDFVGYRLSGDLLDQCGFGAGTAQTLMLRAGLAYDIDISRLVR